LSHTISPDSHPVKIVWQVALSTFSPKFNSKQCAVAGMYTEGINHNLINVSHMLRMNIYDYGIIPGVAMWK